MLRDMISDVMIRIGKTGRTVSMIGCYDGTAVCVNELSQMNQKVFVIPIENETDLGEPAAGGFTNM